MVDFLLNIHNIIFTIALCVVFGLIVIEMVGMLIGLSLMNLLDSIGSMDIDPHLEVNAKAPLLRWLCLDRLPFLVWTIVLLSSFSIAGYIVNFLMIKLIQPYPPLFVSLIIAVLFSLCCSHYIGSIIARIFPKSQSSAVSTSGFSGKIATITMGVAKKGSPAEAALKDEFNQKHYVMVEPCNEEVQLVQGTRVVLVSKKDSFWQAIQLE